LWRRAILVIVDAALFTAVGLLLEVLFEKSLLTARQYPPSQAGTPHSVLPMSTGNRWA
jgi:hypothetical protein